MHLQILGEAVPAWTGFKPGDDNVAGFLIR